MMAKVMWLYICLMLAVAVANADNPNRSVDHDNNDDIEHLAQLICKTNRGNKNLIGRVSDISKIVEYLGETTKGHRLYDCRQKHLSALAELVFAVEALPDDVCGNAKLLLLETYHRKYISKVKKHLREQKRIGGRAPELAKLFFMQYVTEVSTVCEQSALKAIASNSYSFEPDEVAKVEELRKFTDSLGMTDLSDGYKGVYLFWNMVDALDLAQSNKFSKYLSENGPTRVSLQMKDPQPIRAVQAICQHQLKPIYLNSLLPVLRLIDMGYYPNDTKLAEQFSSDTTTRSLFFTTQICETLLPLKLFSDPQLAEDQYVAITKDEAAKLDEPPAIEGIEDQPMLEVPPSSLIVDDLWSFGPTPLDTIKSNVNSRSSVVNRMLKQLVMHVKNKLKSMFKGFRLFSKGDDKKLHSIDDEPTVKDIKAEDVQIREEESEEPSKRVKRNDMVEFTNHLLVLFFAMFYSIYMVILFCLKIVLLSIPTLIALPFIKKGNKRLENTMKTLWTFGDIWTYGDDGENSTESIDFKKHLDSLKSSDESGFWSESTADDRELAYQ